MNDGDFSPISLDSALDGINADVPKLSVLLPLRHDGDPAVFHWQSDEGQNAMWSRSPSARERGRFACVMAMKARAALQEIEDVDPSVEVDLP